MNYTKDNKPRLTLTERAKQHKLLHPNDTNTRREGRGVHWSKMTDKDKKLEQFHKTHIWTYIDANMNKGWVQVATNDLEEEE